MENTFTCKLFHQFQALFDLNQHLEFGGRKGSAKEWLFKPYIAQFAARIVQYRKRVVDQDVAPYDERQLSPPQLRKKVQKRLEARYPDAVALFQDELKGKDSYQSFEWRGEVLEVHHGSYHSDSEQGDDGPERTERKSEGKQPRSILPDPEDMSPATVPHTRWGATGFLRRLASAPGYVEAVDSLINEQVNVL